jgi:uncharacterized membrane protein
MSTSRLREQPEIILSPRRALIAMGTGVLAGLAVGRAGEWELTPVVAWSVATAVALVWVWRIIWPQDPDGTERLAEHEAKSRTTDSVVLVASVASLGAIVLAIVHASDSSSQAIGPVLLSIVAAVLSWALVNTVFALKYARLYYVDEDGGIDFKCDRPPGYSDFAYMAFTVGMAFAVSDTEPTDSVIRKTVLGHALLSYVFGTGILATAINLITNLGQS